MWPFVIGRHLGGVAGGKHVADARHAQVPIDHQAAEIVARRGVCAVSGVARIPAVQIRVEVSMRSPLESFTPVSFTSVHADYHHHLHAEITDRLLDRRPRLDADPAARSRSLRSTITTRISASRPRMSCSRARHFGLAVSMPVKPPPATTTVLRAFEAGRFASACRCSVQPDRLVHQVDAEAVLAQGPGTFGGGSLRRRWRAPGRS